MGRLATKVGNCFGRTVTVLSRKNIALAESNAAVFCLRALRALSSVTVRRQHSGVPAGPSQRLHSPEARLKTVALTNLPHGWSTRSLSSSPLTGVPFLLADIGEGIKEVELLQWFVQPGETVRQFDRVCEVQSDKATVEITSRFDGVVASLCGAVGDMMQVGQPLLYLAATTTTNDSDNATASESSSLYSAAAAAEVEQTATKDQYRDDEERLSVPSVASRFQLSSDYDLDTERAHSNNHKYQSSPAVRKLGAEYNIDLSTLHGSGPNGRLLKCDVVTYLKEQGKWLERLDTEAAVAPSWTPPFDSSTKTKTTLLDSPTATSTKPATITSDTDDIIQLRGYSRLMVKSMTASLQIPHMCFADELVVNRLLETRQLLTSEHATTVSSPTKLGLLVFFIKACSMALSEHPLMNSVVHDADACQLRMIRDHNIGVAVDTPRGLVVPVLRHVQTKSLTQLQVELNQAKEKAAQNKLSADDLQNATFTLSNIGTIGGTYMQPVLTSPQLAMGALGRLQRVPRFVNDSSTEIYAAHVMHVSWAGDHRWLDGALLARFNASFKQFVEQPVTMLAQLK